MIRIAIDGPAASGKGSIARRVAAHYALAHLDTGLLYRATGVKAAEIGPEADLIVVAGSLTPADLARADLRGADAGTLASKAAALPEVRRALIDAQRRFAAAPPPLPDGAPSQGAVLDGRDIGTVILPDAHVKLFVTAQADIRAERRWRELIQRGDSRPLEDVLADIQARDARDSSRAVAPLRPADDAALLDTSELDIDAAVARAIALIDSRMS